MKRVWAIFVLWFAVSNSAYAYYPTTEADCSSVDLRKVFPLKMRDQGDIGWCYAHTAADYLQYYFKIPDQISAADVAIRYNNRLWPRFTQWITRKNVAETGFVRKAIYDSLSEGYCAEEYFPSETWVRIDRDAAGDGAQDRLLSEAIDDLFALQKNIQQGFFIEASELPYYYRFKELSKEKLFTLLQSTSPNQLLNELRIEACAGHRVSFVEGMDGVSMTFRGPHAFQNINSALGQGMPVAVDFFSKMLNDLDHYHRSLSSLHTTLLLGRRFNSDQQECQYLIKNSHGTDCTPYDSRLECQAGYLWVDESSLYGAMVSYDWIRGASFAEEAEDDLIPEQTFAE